ncbi:hypothetical protein [Amycolatopsis sp. H20-H5]|uniref:hypothetical protein n=1 Tax=Amycolatopsis sp. H20-H5 TaxID=3046309 RepID=UPI002DBBB989|nr:hypothetical protein [Amycolatopsis sp. H20-H5]MEC3974396.1 hypothetical protein [Amycolatopsis sp. H20-H5]
MADKAAKPAEVLGPTTDTITSIYGPRWRTTHHDLDIAIKLSRALRTPPFLPVSYVVRPDGEVRRVQPAKLFVSPEKVRRAVVRAEM